MKIGQIEEVERWYKEVLKVKVDYILVYLIMVKFFYKKVSNFSFSFIFIKRVRCLFFSLFDYG